MEEASEEDRRLVEEHDREIAEMRSLPMGERLKATTRYFMRVYSRALENLEKR